MQRVTLPILLATGVSLGAGEPLVVHEWGTFTAVHASDGRLLSGLEREEHALPNFVRSHAGFAPADKGWARPVKNVTIKMETPVLYFYTDTETPVNVAVGFNGGSITDRILPLSITPEPTKVERVLVGRGEVLTPAFEAELVEGFQADGGARWANDRYFLAYRERARQLGVVTPAGASTLPPQR